MKKLCVIGTCTALALVLAVPAGLAAPRKAGGQTRVVCLDEQTLAREYKVTPKHCVFHRRHAPKAEAFFVRTKGDQWSVWKPNHAKGKGRSQPSMGPSTRVRIRLKDPVKRCGHVAFSKAHFFFPKFGTGSTMKIDTCA